jgi:hypothetical protein
LIATGNAIKAVIELQKLIFLGEDLQALKGHCNIYDFYSSSDFLTVKFE